MSIDKMSWSVRCKHISHGYASSEGFIPVLENLSLTLSNGEIATILGPSGCGKSTLTRIISGYEKACSGTIDIKGSLAAGLAQRPITLMAQEDQLLPFRTALQNVLLPAEIAGELTPKAVLEAENLLNGAGLTGFLNALPAEMSGGMRQRCLMVEHLLVPAHMYIFDEPFAALDVQTANVMSTLVYEHRQKTGAGFVLVLHDIDAAVALSDVIYVLSSRPAHVIDVLRPSKQFGSAGPAARKQHEGFDEMILEIIHKIERGNSVGLNKT